MSTNTNLSVTVGDTTCANPTVSQATKLAVITCTVPAGLAPGKYFVNADITKGVYHFNFTKEEGINVKAKYTVTFNSNNTGYGTVDKGSITNIVDGTAISISNNTITIDSNTVTATPTTNTAQYSYSFNNWANNCGNTVTSNCTITANFTRTTNQYTVIWDGNGGSTPAATTKNYGEQIGTLPEPTYDGYNFLGWFTASSGGTQISSSTTVTANVTYWAHWELACTGIMAGSTCYEYMQDFANNASTIKEAMTLEQQYQLIDIRDNKLYWVAKLKDGNVWMTQNLDLDLSTSKALTTTDSNVTSNWTPARSTIATSSSTVSGWTDDYNNPYSADRGSYYLANGSSSNLSAITCTAANNGGENCHYHLGNHYNWSAAVASNDTSGSTTLYTNMPNSICPKGWRLPQGYSGNPSSHSTGDFTKLNNAYGGITNNDGTLRSSPLWFVRSGGVNYGSLYDVGSGGYYWSSTVGDSDLAYNLTFYSSNVSPTNNYDRYDGYSIRCLAQ